MTRRHFVWRRNDPVDDEAGLLDVIRILHPAGGNIEANDLSVLDLEHQVAAHAVHGERTGAGGLIATQNQVVAIRELQPRK